MLPFQCLHFNYFEMKCSLSKTLTKTMRGTQGIYGGPIHWLLLNLLCHFFLLISLPPFSLSGSVSHVLRGACGGCGMVASASFQLIVSINFGNRVFNDSYFLAAQSLTFLQVTAPCVLTSNKIPYTVKVYLRDTINKTDLVI